jgi:large subunit ribosomal protein L18e
MPVSKTKIGERLKRKTNPEIAETLLLAKNSKEWGKVAQRISGSSRNYSSVNLDEIERASKEGESVVVVGKVLGSGSITKKVRVCALGFSESAKEKIKSAKGETVLLADEIKKNPKAQGVNILK